MDATMTAAVGRLTVGHTERIRERRCGGLARSRDFRDVVESGWGCADCELTAGLRRWILDDAFEDFLHGD
jgi:hypothetical protein